MSGIAGMIRFDGQSISPDDLNRLTTLLTHRGNVVSQSIPNGLFAAFGGSIEESAAAPVYATADADIIDDTLPEQPFVANYLKHGPDWFNDLHADFSVVIWDGVQQTVCCARDIAGTKPLHYVYQSNRFFAFATEIKVLLALRDVAVQPNKHKFREYLTWPTSYVPYSNETFYEDIYSVLPGHFLLATATTIEERPYWKPNLHRFKELNTVGDYSEVFHNYFTTAIKGRIQNKKLVGSHLSGGLDSSSVSSVAQSLLMQQQRPSIHTFNIDTEQPIADEQFYVKAVVDKWHPHHHRVNPLTSALDAILEINQLFDRPEQFIIPSNFHLSVSQEAKSIGCDILLTGHDGDSVITPGFEHLDQLIDKGLWEEFMEASRQFSTPPDRNFYLLSNKWKQLPDQAKYEKYVLSIMGSYLKKQFKKTSLPNFVRTALAHKNRLGISETEIATYIYKRIQTRLNHPPAIDNVLREDFKQQTPMRAKRSTQKMVTDLSEDNHIPFEEFLNHNNVVCNEQMNHIGAYYGHPYSFPFFDKQVVELGLATPIPIRFDAGRGRGLIRHGLKDVLPEAIATRVTKANFVEFSTTSAHQLYEATQEQFSSSNHPIWDIVDRSLIDKIAKISFDPRFPVRQKTRYNWLLSRTIYLALWLGSLEKLSAKPVK